MEPARAIKMGFAKSLQFSGRSNRFEFWMVLMTCLAAISALSGACNFARSYYPMFESCGESPRDQFPIAALWEAGSLLIPLMLLPIFARRWHDFGFPGVMSLLFGLAVVLASFLNWENQFLKLTREFDDLLFWIANLTKSGLNRLDFGYPHLRMFEMLEPSVFGLFAVNLASGFVPGSARPNRYGPPPSEALL